MRETVIVTEKEYAKAKSVFSAGGQYEIFPAPAREQVLADTIIARGCRAVILGVDAYSGLLYEALGKTGGDRGAIIARFGVGTDGVNQEQARQHNISVTNTPGVLDQSVAEHAIWLMGALARHIARMDAEMRAGEFESHTGMELNGKTLGLIGFGAIGRRVARIAAFGLDMNVMAADVRNLDPGAIKSLKSEFGITAYTNDIDVVLKQADIISIHLPGIPETYHYFNAERLGLLRPDAMLINTARGSVVDERALYDALAAGVLAGAALDVFEQEPYVPVDPARDLRTRGNILLTPHIGSNTKECNIRIAQACLRHIDRFFQEL